MDSSTAPALHAILNVKWSKWCFKGAFGGWWVATL